MRPSFRRAILRYIPTINALWTPANLVTPAKIVFDPTTGSWSGTNFSTMPNIGSLGGSINNYSSVVQRVPSGLNGHFTAAFAGSESAQLASTTWNGNVCLFMIIKPTANTNTVGAITGHSWPGKSGMTAYIQGSGSFTMSDVGLPFSPTLEALFIGSDAGIVQSGVSAVREADDVFSISFLKSGTECFSRTNGSIISDDHVTHAVEEISGQPFIIGGNTVSGEYFKGELAYFAAFNDPTTDEILKLEGWAAHKYGLTANLPADHPYKSLPPYSDSPALPEGPQFAFSRWASGITITNSNNTAQWDTASPSGVLLAISDEPLLGKKYWEVTINVDNPGASGGLGFGVCEVGTTPTDASGLDGYAAGLYDFKEDSNVNTYINTTYVELTGAGHLTTGDIIGMAYDADADTISWYKNNTLLSTGGHSTSGLTGDLGLFVYFGSGSSVGQRVTLNTGATAFTYTPPSGFTGPDA